MFWIQEKNFTCLGKIKYSQIWPEVALPAPSVKVHVCSELRLQQCHHTQHGHPLPAATTSGSSCLWLFIHFWSTYIQTSSVVVSSFFFSFEEVLDSFRHVYKFHYTSSLHFLWFFPLVSTPPLSFLSSSPVGLSHPYSFSQWNPSPQLFFLSFLQCVWPTEFK